MYNLSEAQAKRAADAYNRMVSVDTAVASDNHRTEWKSVDGLGQPVAHMSMDTYMAARRIYGDDCWNDPDFVKAWLRDNPQHRVKISRGTRGQELVHG